MSDHRTLTSSIEWSQYAKQYDPIKIGSIDGTDLEPHDKAIVRALDSEYFPNRHVKGRPECTIFVARLNPKTTKDTIKDVFSKFGRLRRFRMVKDIVTGAPKGYAFIEYETERAAEEAYRKAHKIHIDGQAIFVDFECERLLKEWKPRRLGGGFGGKKESGQLRFGCRDRPFRKPIDLEIQEERERQQHEGNRRYSNDRNRSRSSQESHRRQSPERSKKERCRSREKRECKQSSRESSREWKDKHEKSENGSNKKEIEYNREKLNMDAVKSKN